MNVHKSNCLKLGVTALVLAGVGACSSFSPQSAVPPMFYALARAQASVPALPLAAQKSALPTLAVNPSSAASGFDSRHIIYQRQPYKLDYFANSEWIDPPARMLRPLLADAIAKTGAFQAVVLTPGAAAGDVRLDTEIVRLVQDFTVQPSQVRFTLRATLVSDKTRRVVGWQEFHSNVAAPSEDAYGGVLAANLAVQQVSQALADFCAAMAITLPKKPS